MTKDNTSIIFQGKNWEIFLREDIKHETIWANQKQISDIFWIDRTVVTRHINNIFKDGELDKNLVRAKYAHTTKHWAIEGKTQTKETYFYNLDIILAVGYRTNSSQAMAFRKWANSILKEYITQGYLSTNKENI